MNLKFFLTSFVYTFCVTHSQNQDFDICFPERGPFKDYYPTDSVKDADDVYSISTGYRMSRPIVAYLCEQNSKVPIDSNHVMYSTEKNPKYFIISSAVVNDTISPSGSSLKFCQFAANDFDLSSPRRFYIDDRHFKLFCTAEGSLNRELTLPPVRIHGNVLIAQGLHHIVANLIEGYVLRKIGFHVFAKTKYTNPIKVFSHVPELQWLGATQVLEIMANHPFDIEFAIVDHLTNTKIESGFDSTLVVEATIAYQHKQFSSEMLVEDYLHKTIAEMAGDEVILSHRNYDQVLHKRADKGLVKFSNVVIRDAKELLFINATLLNPLTGFRQPFDYSDISGDCISKSFPNEMGSESFASPKFSKFKTYGDHYLYTLLENCENSKAVKTIPVKVNSQVAHELLVVEDRNSNIVYVATNFQIPELWVVVVDNDGQRVFSGPDSELLIEVKTDKGVSMCNTGTTFKTHRGSGKFLGSVCDIATDVHFYFTAVAITSGEKLISNKSETYEIINVINIALFGRFNTAGHQEDPDPLVETFAHFATRDLKDQSLALSEKFKLLQSLNISINLKIYDTEQSYTKTIHSFIDMIQDIERSTKEDIMGIIGFGSNAITKSMYSVVASYKIPIIAYREFWREFTWKRDFGLLCAINWNELQIVSHMGVYSKDRGWNHITVIEDTETPIEPGFRQEMTRYKYTFSRLVLHNQTDLAEDIAKLKTRTKFIYSNVHAPRQYFLYREAIKNNFAPKDGYQWVVNDVVAKQFDWENKHPLCAMKPTCTEGFEGMMLLHAMYNLSGFSTPLWYHVNRKFFEMNPLHFRGIPTLRSHIIAGAIALGYDAVLTYAYALNELLKRQVTVTKESVPKLLIQGLEFEGLTGVVKFAKGNCLRRGAQMALSTVTPDVTTATGIVPSLYHKDTVVRTYVLSRGYENLVADEIEKRRKRRALTFEKPDEKTFNDRIWIVVQHMESSKTDIQLYKTPTRPLRIVKTMDNIVIYLYLSIRGYGSFETNVLKSENQDTDVKALCIRTEITTNDFRCKDGCGGGRLYVWSTIEYKHGKCVSTNECECNFAVRNGSEVIAYSDDICERPVCGVCFHGTCKTPFNCVCDKGWKGNKCDKATCRSGCVHGECKTPDWCACDVGYFGNRCDILVGEFLAIILGCLAAMIFSMYIFQRWFRNKRDQKELKNLDWLVDWNDVIQGKISQATTANTSLAHDNAIQEQHWTKFKQFSDVTGTTPVIDISENVVEWKGKTCYVKKFLRESLEVESTVVQAEIKQLKELKHNNLIEFIGACLTAPNVAILLEIAPKGSLYEILQNETYNLTWTFKFSLLRDIATGMQYLHESKLGSHGHLKSTNCLVDNRWTCKVSGFGAHKIRNVPVDTDDMEMLQRYMLWTAPELLRLFSYPNEIGSGTKFGDVYSYGIIMTEMCNHEPAFNYELAILSVNELLRLLKYMHDPANRGLKNLLETHNYDTTRPIRPVLAQSNFPQIYAERKGLQQLITETTAELPERRPVFDVILLKLESFCRLRGSLVENLISMLENYANHLEEMLLKKMKQVEFEKNKTAELISRLLPAEIIERLKLKHEVHPQYYPSVTILYSDLVGFTAIAKESSPMQVVEMLNDLYTLIDSIIAKFNAYKLETIGDAYCIVSGIPIPNIDHYEQISTVALYILSSINSFVIPHMPHTKLQIRIGIHTGSCVAGIVGVTMPRYCIFGEDVLLAQYMESYGEPDAIQVSALTAALLDEIGSYYLAYRTVLDVKFIGPISTFWLLGKEGFDKQLPQKLPKLITEQDGKTNGVDDLGLVLNHRLTPKERRHLSFEEARKFSARGTAEFQDSKGSSVKLEKKMVEKKSSTDDTEKKLDEEGFDKRSETEIISEEVDFSSDERHKSESDESEAGLSQSDDDEGKFKIE